MDETIPDEERGYFTGGAIHAAIAARRQAAMDDLFARAVAGDLLLTDIADESTRWAIRFRGALAVDHWPTEIWIGDDRYDVPTLAVRVAWPAGHADPFAGRPDDPFVVPETVVRFVPTPEGDRPWDDGRDNVTAWLGLAADPEWVAHGPNAYWDASVAWAIWHALAGHGEALGAAPPEPTFPLPSGACRAPSRTGGAATLAVLPAPIVPPPIPGDAVPTAWRFPRGERHRHVARWLPGAPVSGEWRTRIAGAPDGTLYQTVAGDREVRRYSADGALLARWGRDDGPAGLRAPVGVAVGPDGTVYVADRGAGAVQLYGPDGAHLATWRGGPEPDEHGNRPDPWHSEFSCLFDVLDVAVSADGGTVLVPDLGQLELHWLGPRGQTVRTDGANDVIAVALSHDGARHYEISSKGGQFCWGEPDGRGLWVGPPFIDEFDGGYEAVSVAPDRTIYLVRERMAQVLWIAEDGELLDVIDVGEFALGEEPDGLADPEGWFVHRFARRAAPSGVAATRRDGRMRVHVSLHDGSIEVFERDA